MKKIVKIGPVDTEIALLIVKKNKKKKLRKVKYIARSASLPSGLNNSKGPVLGTDMQHDNVQ